MSYLRLFAFAGIFFFACFFGAAFFFAAFFAGALFFAPPYEGEAWCGW